LRVPSNGVRVEDAAGVTSDGIWLTTSVDVTRGFRACAWGLSQMDEYTRRETLREPVTRAVLLCDKCRLALDSPGVMIARGRIVTHVKCDTAVLPIKSAQFAF
jgi:hypothetical protein